MNALIWRWYDLTECVCVCLCVHLCLNAGLINHNVSLSEKYRRKAVVNNNRDVSFCMHRIPLIECARYKSNPCTSLSTTPYKVLCRNAFS